MKNTKTRTLLLLHLAVFLAGWTGVFGRLISLDGLPLVWYRVLVSLPAMLAVLALTGRLHRSARSSALRCGALGILLALHWVCFYESIQASNVSVGVACIATTCFFSSLFERSNAETTAWLMFIAASPPQKEARYRQAIRI